MSENFSPNNGSADAPKFTPAPPPQGAPVPPPMQGYQPKPSAALAITALVLGILGVLGSWVPLLGILAFLISFIPILGWLLGIGAVVCGAIGLSKIKKQLASGKGMAITGIVLGSIGFVAACGWFIFGLIAYAAGAR